MRRCQTRIGSTCGSVTGARNDPERYTRVVGELRQPLGDRRLELEESLLVEHHRRHRCDRLAHREQPHDRVVGERRTAVDVALAVGRRVHELTLAAHGDVPAGELLLVDVPLEVSVDAGEPVGVRSRPRRGRSRSSVRSSAEHARPASSATSRPHPRGALARVYGGAMSDLPPTFDPPVPPAPTSAGAGTGRCVRAPSASRGRPGSSSC